MNKIFYNKKWEEWDDMIVYSPAPVHRRRILLKLICQFARTDTSLHDIGCGNGFLLNEIRSKFAHLMLSGSDISDGIIKKNKSVYPDLKFYVFDIGKDFYHPVKYDIVICSEVLEHIENHEIAIRNLYKLLKPSGIAIVTIPSGRVYKIDKMVGHYGHFKDSLLFQKYFTIRKELHWGFPFFNLYKMSINIKPDYINQKFCKSQYTFMQRLFSRLIYYLFFLNLNIWGNQMIIVLQPKFF